MVDSKIERWQCVPMAFSLVTGVSMNEFMGRLGHDGSEIVDLSMPDPMCRRGFACQEMLSILPEYGWAGTRLDLGCRINSYDKVETQYYYELNYQTSGVVFMSRRMHALAWINGQFRDYSGVVDVDPEITCYVPLFRLTEITSCQNQINFKIAEKIS